MYALLSDFTLGSESNEVKACLPAGRANTVEGIRADKTGRSSIMDSLPPGGTPQKTNAMATISRTPAALKGYSSPLPMVHPVPVLVDAPRKVGLRTRPIRKYDLRVLVWG